MCKYYVIVTRSTTTGYDIPISYGYNNAYEAVWNFEDEINSAKVNIDRWGMDNDYISVELIVNFEYTDNNGQLKEEKRRIAYFVDANGEEWLA